MPALDEIAIEAKSSPSRDVHRCIGCGRPVITAPALQCANCGAELRLRCFVRRASNSYVAECIDLDISAEAATQEGAIQGLQDAMDGYLSVALEPNMSVLVLRPSPLLHRVRYYFDYAKSILSGIVSRPQEPAEKFYAIPVGVSHCHY